MSEKAPKYPLLPYSQLVWDMMQAEPEIYNFDSIIKVKKTSVDAVKLKQAILTALNNHPVFSMGIDSEGRQSYQPQDDILNGQFHSISVEEQDCYLNIHIHFNRILGDNRSVQILAEDILRAYNGLELEKDYYLEYLEWLEGYKQSERYAKHRALLENEFSIDCPVHPTTDLPLSADVKAIEGTWLDDFTDMRESLQAVSERYIVSLSALFSLAAAMAIMQYNGTDKAALTWAYEGREKPIEQRVFGSLHRDIPIFVKADADKEVLLKQIRTQMRQGIAHSSYPYTLLKPNTERWNYAVNVLLMPTDKELPSMMPFEAEVIIPQEERPAYSLLDIEIYDDEQLTLLYRYSTTHYKQESINHFACLLRKNIEWLSSVIRDNGITE